MAAGDWFDLQVHGQGGKLLRTPTSLIGFFIHATLDYTGYRHAAPNAGASDRIADASSAISPAPRTVRDVELVALEHVKPSDNRAIRWRSG
jgi:hypothetical protein